MAKPKRPGPKPRGKTAATMIGLRVTAEERRAWSALANRQGVTLSVMIREAVEMAVARGSTR